MFRVSGVIDPIGSGVADFLDRPGAKGSGGSGPANGVAAIQGSSGSQPSYIETCTLLDSRHVLCTAALDDFVPAYGSP